MKRNHNSVLGVILAVVIGLCLLPSSALSTSTVLNKFEDIYGNRYLGNLGRVDLNVTPGEADFNILVSGHLLHFIFTTTLTLYPENFPLGYEIYHPPGTPLTGSIVLDLPYGGDFEILNPSISSEDQFGPFYQVYVRDFLTIPPGGLSGVLTNEVPEPSTMLLLGSGLIGLAGYGRRKFFKK